MIFQSLILLYERLSKANEVPPYGFSMEDIGFEVIIDKSGKMLYEPQTLRVQKTDKSGKLIPNKFTFHLSEVPYYNDVNVRSSGAANTPNFMVDKADYIFGMPGTEKKEKYRQSFITMISEVCGDSIDDGILAVKSFLLKWDSEDSLYLKDWKEISGTYGKWIAFKLEGENNLFIHERPEVKALWLEYISKQKFKKGKCLVDGNIHDLQSQYSQFKFGTGASLSSCKDNYSWSYGKICGENAPISVEAEFKSSTALKYLFRSKSQRIQIGDITTVFWAESKSPIETFMGQILDSSVQDKAATIQVQEFLKALRNGRLPDNLEQDKDINFYILGLSLNKARLALRFWYVCTVKELIKHLRDHFICIEMVHSDHNNPFPEIRDLLKQTVRDSKNISPVLAGSLMRSILTGSNYPQNLYQSVLGRIKADQARKDEKTGKQVSNVNYFRAAILKAVLQRNHKMEVPMSLDTNRREIGYLLGRLFAVLEKTQRDALGNLNATIRDRCYSTASTTPASIYPRLLGLSIHHIKKSPYGENSDIRIREIIDHVDDFPTYMDLMQQGLFHIAYYQQKNAFYTGSVTKNQE